MVAMYLERGEQSTMVDSTSDKTTHPFSNSGLKAIKNHPRHGSTTGSSAQKDSSLKSKILMLLINSLRARKLLIVIEAGDGSPGQVLITENINGKI